MFLAYDTGSFNTLHKRLLTEKVQNHKGEDNHNTASIINRCIVKRLCRIACCSFQAFGDLQNIWHQVNCLTREEDRGVEVIRPLPAEGEQEDGDHHGERERKNDLEEGTEGVGTVYVRRLLKFIRNSREELTHHEDVKTVLKA